MKKKAIRNKRIMLLGQFSIFKKYSKMKQHLKHAIKTHHLTIYRSISVLKPLQDEKNNFKKEKNYERRTRVNTKKMQREKKNFITKEKNSLTDKTTKKNTFSRKNERSKCLINDIEIYENFLERVKISRILHHQFNQRLNSLIVVIHYFKPSV